VVGPERRELVALEPPMRAVFAGRYATNAGNTGRAADSGGRATPQPPVVQRGVQR